MIDLQAADRRAVARRLRQHSLDRVAGKLGGADVSRRKFEKNGLFLRGGGRVNPLVDRRAQLAGQLGVQLGRIAASTRHQFPGQQAHDYPIFIGRPHFAVAPEKRRARALFATEAKRSVEQARDEPLESDRHLDQRAPESWRRRGR